MEGIDLVEAQRRGFQLRAWERLDMAGMGLRKMQAALAVHLHDNRRDFQDGVFGGIETGSLDIDDYRQEAAETAGENGMRWIVH
ncbi:hypothetical protein MishRS11D_01180 [Methylomagnum ishizawai]|nr:hypothetical protein MishRS11D_01180 [Methylomagnum ishizawai]